MVKNPHDDYDVYRLSDKKSKKSRLIQSPSESLKIKQKNLINLYERFPLHPSCSCRKGSGPIDAARPHLGAKYLLKVDISNCYQRITLSKTKKAILESGIQNSLKNEMISNLDTCFIEWDGEQILPTGSPTSSILCNITLSQIDEIVSDLALKNNYTYTRYMDDLNLSTSNEKRKWELIDIVSSILSFYGYPINKHKTRWMGRGNNDEKLVAGINLETLSRRNLKRMLRARLNNSAKNKTNLDSITQGYLAYIKSIDPSSHDKLLTYYNKRLTYTE